MGKRIISQARGKGSPTYRAPSFKYKGKVKHKSFGKETVRGKIVDFVTCRGHSAPLAQVQYEDGELCYLLAPEGLCVGDSITEEGDLSLGSSLSLENIPEGTAIYNLENKPGDGGKFCRSSGTAAKIVSKQGDHVIVMLPSKKQKTFHKSCRATIGVIAAGGRTEKPFLKAGNKYYAKRAKNKIYPVVSAASMNAADHPYGNSRSSRKARAKPTSGNAPPGRKVGMVKARRTGRKK